MKLSVDGVANGAPISPKFAFGNIPAKGHFELSDNINPHLTWSDAPAGTKSFAIIMHDPDVPSSGDDVNQEGKIVPPDLPRVNFYHWVLINVPAGLSEITEGADSNVVTPTGKAVGEQPHGHTGINSYTDWFTGDPDMGGNYGGYDGPCPPWNDSIMHHYHFTIYALDIEKLDLDGAFTGAQALAAMDGHILDQALQMGTYSMNPAVRNAA
jgi:Raf kinase inhibitor-like YbhB/YbcL family protein